MRFKVGFKVIQDQKGDMRESLPYQCYTTEVAGIPAYQNIKDVPGDVDLAFVSLPATGVFDALKDCAEKTSR